MLTTNTTKHDRIRLLHLFVDPHQQVYWQQIGARLSRQAMDNKETRHYEDPWDQLVKEFNDTEKNNYKSVICEKTNLGQCRGPKARCQACHGICCDLDPSQGARPIRDVEWMKKVWREIKTSFTIVYGNWKRSGDHEGGADPFDVFYDRFAKGDAVHMYTFVLFDAKILYVNLMGKVLPDEASRDYGSSRDAEGDYHTTQVSKKLKTEKANPNEFTLQVNWGQLPSSLVAGASPLVSSDSSSTNSSTVSAASSVDKVVDALLKVIACPGITADLKRRAENKLAVCLGLNCEESDTGSDY
jgi:hypothetical protein